MAKRSLTEIMQEQSFQNQSVDAVNRSSTRKSAIEQKLFERWETAEKALQKMEEIRDTHEPKPDDEEWHPLFKMALECIPLARERARQCWLDYMDAGKKFDHDDTAWWVMVAKIYGLKFCESDYLEYGNVDRTPWQIMLSRIQAHWGDSNEY